MAALVNDAHWKPLGFVPRLIGEARERNPVLFRVAAGHLLLLALMLVVAPFDARTVMGINPWVKPMKFAISIAVYALTLGWLLHYLPVRCSVGWPESRTAFDDLQKIGCKTLDIVR